MAYASNSVLYSTLTALKARQDKIVLDQNKKEATEVRLREQQEQRERREQKFESSAYYMSRKRSFERKASAVLAAESKKHLPMGSPSSFIRSDIDQPEAEQSVVARDKRSVRFVPKDDLERSDSHTTHEDPPLVTGGTLSYASKNGSMLPSHIRGLLPRDHFLFHEFITLLFFPMCLTLSWCYIPHQLSMTMYCTRLCPNIDVDKREEHSMLNTDRTKLMWKKVKKQGRPPKRAKSKLDCHCVRE